MYMGRIRVWRATVGKVFFLKNGSYGILKPRIFLGRWLSWSMMQSSSFWVTFSRVVIWVNIVEWAHWCFHSNPVRRKKSGGQSRYWPTGFERYPGIRRTPARCHRWGCGVGFDRGLVLVLCFGALGWRVWFYTLYGNDYTSVFFPCNCIAFPITDSGFLSNKSRTLLNADTVGDTFSVVLLTITLTPFFLATQVLV